MLKKFSILKKQQKGKGRPSDLTKRIKILTPREMLQILPIALTSIKAGNTFENLLNQIKQIICSSLKVKKVTEKVYNNVTNSIKL